MEMRNMKETFGQFTTSCVISVDDSGTSFSKIPIFHEITYGGQTEEKVTSLGKQKVGCIRRIQNQEEELEELTGQVQSLERAKPRLDMMLESMRKEANKRTLKGRGAEGRAVQRPEESPSFGDKVKLCTRRENVAVERTNSKGSSERPPNRDATRG